MGSDKTSAKYKTLLSEGPKTAEQLGGHPSVDERRIYDIRKFNPRDQTTALWYLDDHDREQILRAWLSRNQRVLEGSNTNKRTISYALGNEWMDVWRETRDEYDWLSSASGNAGGANEQRTMTCPKCGDDEVKNLPRHLRGCTGDSR